MFFLIDIEGEIVILLLNKKSVRMWDGGLLLWTRNWDFWMMYNVVNYLGYFVTKAGLLAYLEGLFIIDITLFMWLYAKNEWQVFLRYDSCSGG